MNTISDNREWIYLGNNLEETFYELKKPIYQRLLITTRGDQGMLYASINVLDHEKSIHSRHIYGFIDFLGDIGGVQKVISYGFGLILLPISYHSFILKASRKFFMARTCDDNLFK